MIKESRKGGNCQGREGRISWEKKISVVALGQMGLGDLYPNTVIMHINVDVAGLTSALSELLSHVL